MKKSKMIESILSVKHNPEHAYISRVYGVTCGVGYDIDVTVIFQGVFTLDIEAHASRQGWAYPEHLRPNNPYYKYTGSNDVYQEEVIKYWMNGSGFKSYLNGLKKDKLEVIYNYVMEGLK